MRFTFEDKHPYWLIALYNFCKWNVTKRRKSDHWVTRIRVVFHFYRVNSSIWMAEWIFSLESFNSEYNVFHCHRNKFAWIDGNIHSYHSEWQYSYYCFEQIFTHFQWDFIQRNLESNIKFQTHVVSTNSYRGCLSRILKFIINPFALLQSLAEE